MHFDVIAAHQNSTGLYNNTHFSIFLEIISNHKFYINTKERYSLCKILESVKNGIKNISLGTCSIRTLFIKAILTISQYIDGFRLREFDIRPRGMIESLYDQI